MTHLSAVATAPARLPVGDVQPLVLTITNSGPEPLVVTDLDVQKTLLAGVEVLAVDPPPTRRDLYLRNYQIYRLQLSVPARQSATVTFSLRGVTAGTYAGDIDVDLDAFHFVTCHLDALQVGAEAVDAWSSALTPSGATPSAISPPSTPPTAPSGRGADSPPAPTPPTTALPAPQP